MWILQRLNNEEIVHYLTCGSTLNVGRFGNEYITLAGDKSISKRHASFFLRHEEQNLGVIECLPKITLTDLKSSNGTYIKKSSATFIKILPETPENLQHGDLIRFGRENTWKVLYKPFIVTTSMIDKETKLSIKSTMQVLGGHVVKEWQEECTLLVMDGLKLSAKTVSALASGVPIVMSSYLTDMLNSIMAKTPLPNPQDYLPPLQELSINAAEVSFLPDLQRKNLFSGKTFWFLTNDSQKKLSCIIKAAGGVYDLLTEREISKVVLENNILVKPNEKEANIKENPLYNRAVALMNENRLNMVPEQDVGLAIAYKSLVKYCNPRFHANGILRPRKNGTQRTQSLKIFATETQPESLPLPSHPVSRTTILDSGASSKGKVSSCSKSDGTSSPGRGQTDRPGTSGNSLKAKASCPAESLPQVVHLEDKENFGKRKRSPNAEKTSPSSKRDSSYRMRASVLSNTEIIDLSEDVVDDCGSFNPIHFSTQKDEPPKPAKDSFLAPNPVTKNVRVASPQDKQAKPLSPSNSSYPSIPFDPYTLPSIRIEDIPTAEAESSIDRMDADDEGELTQPFTRESVLEEVPRRSHSEEKKEGRTNMINSWMGAHNITTVVAETPSGSSTKVKEAERLEPRARRARSPVADEGEFALPFTSERRKRRRDVLNEENQSLMTTSVKESQPPKQIKLEAESNPPLHLSEKNDTVFQKIKKSASEKGSESRNTARNELEKENLRPFVSKQESIVKRDNSDDEVADLGNTLEKSLVVVRVVNLVKKKNSTPTPTSVSSNLPNFKKFKKVLPSSTRGNQDEVNFLPRIIGGRDLVSHSECDNRREIFLASQPGLVQELDRMEEDRRTKDPEDKEDSNFTLLRSRPNQKKRGRL